MAVDMIERKAALREKRMALKERRARLAESLLKQAEVQASRLTESYDDWGPRGITDVLDRLRIQDAPGHAPISTPADRRHGHNWPFWRTWQEHARIRAAARLLVGLSGIADGALNGLSSYVVGTGYTYRAATKDQAPAALVGAVQDVIDEYVLRTDSSQMEKESFRRSRRDGEVLHLHEEIEPGYLDVSVIEPEELQQPPDGDNDWTYGIRTRGRATHRPLAYHVVDPEYGGPEGAIYDPDELFHFKVNVDTRIKRGLTDFCYDTHDFLRTAGRLVDHTGQGAAIQASIALIREHESASPAQVQDFIAASAAAERVDPVRGTSEQIEAFYPGKILDINAGQKFIVAPFAQNVSGYTAVIQAVLRAVAVKWNAPEWIVSADASNNNYSSSITAESPFVKRCYAEQDRHKAFSLRSVWAAVRCAARAGRIRAQGKVWSAEEVEALIEIQAEAPNIEVRDDNKTAQTDKVYIDARVKSPQTTQQELGLDSEQEANNWKVWKSQTDSGEEDAASVAARSKGILDLQASYYQKQLPRAAAIANATLTFGLDQQQAESLFVEMADPKPPADPPVNP